MRLVFDTENNGLYDEATTMWCMVAKDIDTGEVYKYGPDEIDSGINHLRHSNELIGHNIIGYDLPVIIKLYGVNLSDKVLWDTLVISRLLNPDRPGGHSLDAWGKRVGKYKQYHDDWSKYSDEMMERCASDVEINHLVYLELLEEMEDG